MQEKGIMFDLKKLLLILSLVLVSVFSFADSSNPHELVLKSLIVMGEKHQLHAQPLEVRIIFFAQYFLGQRSPYIANPLGEGPQGEFDQAPLYRFDGFDCTTFVETILALSLSRSVEEFDRNLKQIRYKDGLVGYQTRNHFPSIDWIPNNSAQGFVKDITAEIDPVNFKTSRTWIQKDEWVRMKGVDFAQMSFEFSKQWAEINYLPKEQILSQSEVFDRIPEVAIFHIVRPQWNLQKAIGTHLDVSHMGFLIRERGEFILLHASNGVRDGGGDYKGVKRESLRDYIERVMMKSPTMAGINLLKIFN